MNLTFSKGCLVALLLAISTSGIAQSNTSIIRTNTSDTTKEYSTEKLRTWSVGANAGILTHWTPFNRTTNGDYRSTHSTFGYNFFVKKQLVSVLGLQADFLFGKVHGSTLNNFPAGATGQDQSGYDATINWSASLSAYLSVPNLSMSVRNSSITPYLVAGAGYMSFSTKVNNAPGANNVDDKTWYLPLGIGFKIKASDAVNVDLGYTVYSLRTNKFDGYMSGLHDHISYLHLGLEYTFGKKGSKPMQSYSTVAETHQIATESDEQLKARLAAEEQKRLQDEKDMADDDNDGVANKYDKCPGTPANTPVDGGGCPLPVAVKEKVVITQEDRRVIGDAIKNLEFAYGKAIIKESSYPTLDRVADLLMKKDFSLKLAGHTDNRGTMAANLRLSKARAEAVKNYLVAKGANASRIEATGYGWTQPIATNKTAKGRQINRRVEFTLL